MSKQGEYFSVLATFFLWVVREMCFILICFLDEHFSEESDKEDESDDDEDDDDDFKLPGNLNSSQCYYFSSIKTICIYIKKKKKRLHSFRNPRGQCHCK